MSTKQMSEEDKKKGWSLLDRLKSNKELMGLVDRIKITDVILDVETNDLLHRSKGDICVSFYLKTGTIAKMRLRISYVNNTYDNVEKDIISTLREADSDDSKSKSED